MQPVWVTFLAGWWTITFSSILRRQNCLCSPLTHHFTTTSLYSWFVNHNSFQDCQEPWSCDRWSVKLHRPYCYKRPGPADLPYTTLGRLGPSCQSKLHNSLSKLLFSPDWTIVMLSWRVFPHVLSSLCNWSRMQQPEWSLIEPKKGSRYPSLHQVTLATNSRSHQIQGTDVCLQDHNWHCTNIPKLASSNLCAPPEACVLQVNDVLWCHPKRYQITLTDLYQDCAQLV